MLSENWRSDTLCIFNECFGDYALSRSQLTRTGFIATYVQLFL
jgi:hypothetical protein